MAVCCQIVRRGRSIWQGLEQLEKCELVAFGRFMATRPGEKGLLPWRHALAILAGSYGGLGFGVDLRELETGLTRGHPRMSQIWRRSTSAIRIGRPSGFLVADRDGLQAFNGRGLSWRIPWDDVVRMDAEFPRHSGPVWILLKLLEALSPSWGTWCESWSGSILVVTTSGTRDVRFRRQIWPLRRESIAASALLEALSATNRLSLLGDPDAAETLFAAALHASSRREGRSRVLILEAVQAWVLLDGGSEHRRDQSNDPLDWA